MVARAGRAVVGVLALGIAMFPLAITRDVVGPWHAHPLRYAAVAGVLAGALAWIAARQPGAARAVVPLALAAVTVAGTFGAASIAASRGPGDPGRPVPAATPPS